MNTFSVINPTHIEHEGFYYLEYNGMFFKGCKRCGGEGHYSHNGEHSRCYDCNNTEAKLGEHLADRVAAERWCHERAVRRAQRERKREAERVLRVTKMENHQQELKATDAEVFEFLMGIVIEDDSQEQYPTYEEWAAATHGISTVEYEKDGFLRSMAETLRWVGPSKPFTPNMIAAVRKSMERRAERAAESAAHPAPKGRVVVTGEIASVKLVEGDYGVAYKILVKDDAGYKVWVSLPKAQGDEAYDTFLTTVEEQGSSIYNFGSGIWFLGIEGDENYTGVKGRRITFTATLEPSADNVAFAFGSRPTKGAWL